MTLQNGYKVIYEKITDGARTFYASKTGLFEDAEQIGEPITIGEYKLIYEKDGMFYGSTTGIPSEDDHCFEEFNAIFEKAEEEAATEPAAYKAPQRGKSAVTPPAEEEKVDVEDEEDDELIEELKELENEE